MKTREIKTLVRSNHGLGKNVFVRGRIVGAMAAMCKDDPAAGEEFAQIPRDNGDHILTVATTDEKYEAFAKVIESWYAGLCTFDYVE